jgi:hypothetical protein
LTATAPIRTGWGALLLGDQIDLEDWEYLLKAPFDPWVERYGGDLGLRAAEIDRCADLEEMQQRSLLLLDHVNGAVAASDGYGMRAVRFGGVVEFQSDGSRVCTVLAQFDGRFRARARAARSPHPLRPSETQSWAALAGVDEYAADALINFGRAGAGNWFDLYKAFESIQTSGKLDRAAERSRTSKNAIDDLTETAAFFRHALTRNKAQKRRGPKMNFGKARELVRALLQAYLEDLASLNSRGSAP